MSGLRVRVSFHIQIAGLTTGGMSVLRREIVRGELSGGEYVRLNVPLMTHLWDRRRVFPVNHIRYGDLVQLFETKKYSVGCVCPWCGTDGYEHMRSLFCGSVLAPVDSVCMPPPDKPGRWRHCIVNLSARPSVCPLPINLWTPYTIIILETSELISM